MNATSYFGALMTLLSEVCFCGSCRLRIFDDTDREKRNDHKAEELSAILTLLSLVFPKCVVILSACPSSLHHLLHLRLYFPVNISILYPHLRIQPAGFRREEQIFGHLHRTAATVREPLRGPTCGQTGTTLTYSDVMAMGQ